MLSRVEQDSFPTPSLSFIFVVWVTLLVLAVNLNSFTMFDQFILAVKAIKYQKNIKIAHHKFINKEMICFDNEQKAV